MVISVIMVAKFEYKTMATSATPLMNARVKMNLFFPSAVEY